MREKRRLPGCS